MRINALGLLAGAALAALSVTSQAKADEAAFGCQVLLCAASQNPSWSGVEYCVPPMTKLISIRKVHPGYWPICPNSGTGKPGFNRYEDCPAGAKDTYIDRSNGDNSRSVPACAITVKVSDRECFRHGGGRDDYGSDSNSAQYVWNKDHTRSCVRTVVKEKALRSDPYYLDIPNDEGVKQRFYFNLRT